MKTAVLGANGYIARNFLKVNAVSRYGEVYAFGRSPVQIDGFVGYRQIDFDSVTDIEEAIVGCGLIYLFAGRTGTVQGFDDPDSFLDANERLLLHLLSAYRNINSMAKIVFPSTRLVYRGDYRSLSEDAPKAFLTPYAMQKYACEQYLEMYRRLYGVRYCVLRIGVPYGTLVQPVSSYGTLDSFLHQARETGQISLYGDGSQRRTVTYIEDLCRMLWLVGLDEHCVNDVYNVGGEDMSIRELAESVALATGAEVTKKPWPAAARKIESGSTVFDASKLEERLRYRPAMTVESWINEMMKIKAESHVGGGYICNLLVALCLFAYTGTVCVRRV